jgi:hypothetical protein
MEVFVGFGVLCVLSFVLGVLPATLLLLLRLADEGAEVAHAILQQRCAASLQLCQELRLVLVDPGAGALVVRCAAGREAVLSRAVVPLAAAQDQLLLLQLAAAVAVQRGHLGQVALNLASQEAGIQRSVGSSALSSCQLSQARGLLLVIPDVAPQPLPVVDSKLREAQLKQRQLRGLLDNVPGATAAAPDAVVVHGLRCTAVARARALVSLVDPPGLVHLALIHEPTTSGGSGGHFEGGLIVYLL